MLDKELIAFLGQILKNQAETINQLNEISSRVKLVEAKVETDLDYKIKALFDAREMQNDKNDTMIQTLERIETKLEILQMETAHLRQAK
ncbi:MAG: hypothetical protein WCR27_06200 [Eubacteriales bacterium]